MAQRESRLKVLGLAREVRESLSEEVSLLRTDE